MLECLNSTISDKAIKQAIHSLPSNKSLRAESFSSEYHKAIQTTLVPYLSTLFNKAVTSASFPEEILLAYIVALPKPGKQPVCPQKF